MSSNLSPVPFHGHTLFVLSHNNEPYTPMKPIVESMGMDWKTQHRKLLADNERWGMVKVRIPSKGGLQTSAAIPLQKLPAYFATVHPSKIKDPETRKRVILFQKECDNALWDYWNTGVAVNPRILSQKQRDEVYRLVESKVKALPDSINKKDAFKEVWGRIKKEFNVSTYKEIDRRDFYDLIAYVDGMVLSFEESLPAPVPQNQVDEFVEQLKHFQEKVGLPLGQTPVVLRQNIVHRLRMPDSLNPTPGELAAFNNLIHSIDRSTRDVEGALLQVQAGLREMESFVRLISKS